LGCFTGPTKRGFAPVTWPGTTPVTRRELKVRSRPEITTSSVQDHHDKMWEALKTLRCIDYVFDQQKEAELATMTRAVISKATKRLDIIKAELDSLKTSWAEAK
jgi:transcription initiation factor IIF auxiliary subunit